MKLMRYESSTTDKGVNCSLTEYIKRMPEDQEKIYYLISKNREMAEASPYMEALQQTGTEVLYCYDQFDDVVFSQVQKFDGKKFISVESSQVEAKVDSAETVVGSPELIAFIKSTLDGKVTEVVSSTRLVSHPAIISDEEASGAVRRMMRGMGQLEQMPG